jgi:hypothetical protein
MINIKSLESNELFQKIESFNLIYNIQSYIPIYKDIESNINVDNYSGFKIKITNNLELLNISYNDITCNIDNKLSYIFCKYAPIIDPIRYMIGKYSDEQEFNLPQFETNIDSVYNTKIYRTNNTAYIDGFYSYISSLLLNKGFVNGINFYGMYLAKHKNFKLNIADDLEFLDKSSYFHKNVNKLFFIDESIFDNDSTCSGKKNEKLNIIQEDLAINICDEVLPSFSNLENNLKNEEPSVFEFEAEPVDENDVVKINDVSSDSESEDSDDSDDSDHEDSESNSDDNESESESGSEDDSDSEISLIEASINDFPVLMIFMEKCKDTLDNLMLYSDISTKEWCSCLMQVILTLVTYQKKFNFTHNDLHTSNIMYIETEKEYLYYKYDNITYKVPTYGKIFKIIDFGRAIYTIKDKLYWSDSYCKDEDAYTQYNFGPFYNSTKKEVKNNYSFDLSRLACSLYDYFDEYNSNDKYTKDLIKLINKWCSDNKGLNLLYNKKGEERYPEFKLYRIISKNVHNCIPKDQLKNPLFTQYIFLENLGEDDLLIDIDSI